eukprot:ANDGO_05262.mRNA.1 Phosphoinositide phosphatase SAC1
MKATEAQPGDSLLSERDPVLIYGTVGESAEDVRVFNLPAALLPHGSAVMFHHTAECLFASFLDQVWCTSAQHLQKWHRVEVLTPNNPSVLIQEFEILGFVNQTLILRTSDEFFVSKHPHFASYCEYWSEDVPVCLNAERVFLRSRRNANKVYVSHFGIAATDDTDTQIWIYNFDDGVFEEMDAPPVERSWVRYFLGSTYICALSDRMELFGRSRMKGPRKAETWVRVVSPAPSVTWTDFAVGADYLVARLESDLQIIRMHPQTFNWTVEPFQFFNSRNLINLQPYFGLVHTGRVYELRGSSRDYEPKVVSALESFVLHRAFFFGGMRAPFVGSVTRRTAFSEKYFLNIVQRKYERFVLYETPKEFVVVASTEDGLLHKILTIRRSLDPSSDGELVIRTDPITYDQWKVSELLNLKAFECQSLLKKPNVKPVLPCRVAGYGILGFIRFLKGYYMLVVTDRRIVGSIAGHIVYSVEQTSLIPLFDISGRKMFGKDLESRYREIFQHLDLTSDFYFSYTYDLSSSLQRNMTTAETGIHSPVLGKNSMFVWNQFLFSEFSNQATDMQGWYLPVIHGWFGQTRILSRGRLVDLVLIARRSRYFAGTRYLKRGADEEGHVANEVECEQILCDTSSFGFLGSRGNITSFVQVRGSIPLYWSHSVANTKIVKPKPDIIMGLFDSECAVTNRHFTSLRNRFGRIIVLNLLRKVEKTPRETLIGKAFSSAVAFLNRKSRMLGRPNNEVIEFISWDFRRASKISPFLVLNDLASVAERAVRQIGFFSTCGQVPSVQVGVVRTNCIDCIDRTNIAQFCLGRSVLASQIAELGLSEEAVSVDGKNEIVGSFLDLFDIMGDRLAVQYGGSPTVSVGVHRRGMSWDLVTNIQRFYSNNFTDSEKQDAINLFLGNFVPSVNVSEHLWELESDVYLHSKAGVLFKRTPVAEDVLPSKYLMPVLLEVPRKFMRSEYFHNAYESWQLSDLDIWFKDFHWICLSETAVTRFHPVVPSADSRANSPPAGAPKGPDESVDAEFQAPSFSSVLVVNPTYKLTPGDRPHFVPYFEAEWRSYLSPPTSVEYVDDAASLPRFRRNLFLSPDDGVEIQLNLSAGDYQFYNRYLQSHHQLVDHTDFLSGMVAISTSFELFSAFSVSRADELIYKSAVDLQGNSVDPSEGPPSSTIPGGESMGSEKEKSQEKFGERFAGKSNLAPVLHVRNANHFKDSSVIPHLQKMSSAILLHPDPFVQKCNQYFGYSRSINEMECAIRILIDAMRREVPICHRVRHIGAFGTGFTDLIHSGLTFQSSFVACDLIEWFSTNWDRFEFWNLNGPHSVKFKNVDECVTFLAFLQESFCFASLLPIFSDKHARNIVLPTQFVMSPSSEYAFSPTNGLDSPIAGAAAKSPDQFGRAVIEARILQSRSAVSSELFLAMSPFLFTNREMTTFGNDFSIYRFFHDIHVVVLNMGDNCDVLTNDPFELAASLVINLNSSIQQFRVITPIQKHTDIPFWAKSYGFQYGALFHLKSVAMHGILNSVSFEQYHQRVAELQFVDLLTLDREEAILFWINVYNALFVHAVLVVFHEHIPFIENIDTVAENSLFYDSFAYVVGGHRFTLSDIKHGILRSNSRRPGRILRQFRSDCPVDPRIFFANHLSPVDGRIHFALLTFKSLYHAYLEFSSPGIVCIMSVGGTHSQSVEYYAAQFLENHVRFDVPTQQIMVDSLFTRCRTDFGPRNEDVLQFIIKNAPLHIRTKLVVALATGSYSLRFVAMT